MAESDPPLASGGKEVEAGLSSPPPAQPLASDLTEDEAVVENAKETNVVVAFSGSAHLFSLTKTCRGRRRAAKLTSLLCFPSLILCLFLAALDQTSTSQQQQNMYKS